VKSIDYLIIKSKKIASEVKDFLTLGMIDNRNGKWNLYCVMERYSGSGLKSIESNHDTLDQAIQEVQKIAEEYPNPYNDVTIIIDDIAGGNP
jgi:hypothetical protein